MKKLISILMAAILSFSVVSLSAFAADGGAISDFSLGMSAEGEEGTGIEIEWYESSVDGCRYLFVPQYLDMNSMNIYFEADADVYIGENKLENGCSAALLADKTEFTLSCAGESCSVKLFRDSAVSSVFIETASGSLDAIHADKEHKEEGNITIINSDGEEECCGELEYIKGRGNSTWGFAKKPYNIKLDKKANLFGMGKSKKWSLLANYDDASLVRNALAYTAAKNAGLPYTPEFEAVDLYINNEYQGAYLLTTRVEIDETRVDITDLEKENEKVNEDVDFEALSRGGTYGTFSGYIEGSKKWIDIENNPANITGGYLLENELPSRYCDEISGFVTEGSQAVVVKSPEYASKAQIDYISDYYQQFENVIRSESSTQADVAKLCDVDSLVKVYLINEWTANHDAGITSSYFYKPVDDVLYAGPVWDFDGSFPTSAKSRFGIDYSNPATWTAAHSRLYAITYFGAGNTTNDSPTYLSSLAKKQWFVTLAKEEWENVMKTAVQKATEYIGTEYYEHIEGSAVNNAIRWNRFGTTDTAAIKTAFASQVKKVTDFSSAKSAFISGNIGTVAQPWSEKTVWDNIKDAFNIFLNDAFEGILVIFGLVNII